MTMTRNPLDPTEVWSRYIGSQTPEEFLRLSDSATIEGAINVYVYSDEFRANFGEESPNRLYEIERALIKYLERNLKN